MYPQTDGWALPGPGYILCSALVSANISLSDGAHHQAVTLQSEGEAHYNEGVRYGEFIKLTVSADSARVISPGRAMQCHLVAIYSNYSPGVHFPLIPVHPGCIGSYRGLQ